MWLVVTGMMTHTLGNRKVKGVRKNRKHAARKPLHVVFSVDFEGLFCYGMNVFLVCLKLARRFILSTGIQKRFAGRLRQFFNHDSFNNMGRMN
jgi:hypothetical protein